MSKAKAAAKPETGTDVVTVALKHPTGIVIEAFEKTTSHEPVLGGGSREVPLFRSTGKQYPINGNRVPFGQRPNFPIIGGYALTQGVPRDVWETWLEQHQDSPLVQNNLISAHESLGDVEDFVNDPDNQATRSGLEPMKLKDDPRTPKTLDKSGKFVDAIVKADEQQS